ncbi:hypothetical protein DMS28_04630 [Klebsiella variicola]|nr:hypothetical protein DMR84_09400 [Klebsiella variicola]PXL27805.1 hypothetical protein DMS28_04630 [Klebsiella variicola]PXL32677.1 hypothetical protein DMS26_06045 [Klebsiella variicola]
MLVLGLFLVNECVKIISTRQCEKIARTISIYIKCSVKNKQWQYVPCCDGQKKGREGGPLFKCDD